MADYYQVKNQNIFTPPANISLGNTSNQYSNVYVQNNLVVGNVTVTSSTIIAPRVTTITYPGNDTAADPAGGQTITLTGSGFVVSASILINSIAVSVVSVVSSTVITFTSPANSSGSYVIYVVNPDGSTAIAVPGIQYSGIPTWTTAAGTLGSLYETASFTESVVATGDAPITYSVASGTLPPGATFNGNGTITGTSQLTASPTTYTFIVSATDAEQQDTNRSFSLTISTDVVTWTTPAANSTTTLGQNVASTTTLLATSAAGKAITYTANTLPTGLSISGATVTGTPTVVGNTSSLFTATAATTGRTTTATINWAVTVSGDTYFPYTTLLLSGGTSTSTFIADASTNNFAVAIAGDTKPNNFNPYTPGYYSNYFDGTGDYLSTTVNLAIATGPFTMEAWVYLTALGSERTILNNLYWQSGNNGGWILLTDTSNRLWLRASTNTFNSRTTVILSSSTLAANIWYHVAVVRDSNNLVSMYFNGVSAATSVTYAASLNQGTGQLFRIGAWNPDGGSQDFWSGYISNARVVVGTAVYTGTFTPSTTPLTAIANTSLLTCQSNRFLDNSTNAYAITKVGDTTVNPTTPFVPNTQYAAYGSTYFDGTGDYLLVGSTPGPITPLISTGAYMTIEAWVYATTLRAGNANDTHPSIVGLGAVYMNFGVANAIPRFMWYNGAITYLDSSIAITANTWNHIAVVFNGSGSSNLKIYVNGVLGGTGTFTNLTWSTGAGGNNLYIGAVGNNQATSCWPGYISNLRITNSALYTSNFTPPSAPLTAITNTSLLTCQTNQPANNSVFLDSSTNAFAVTRVGNTTQGTFTPYGANWSNYFDGTGDKLTLPSSSAFDLSNSTWTIEFWMYSLATPPGGNDCRLLIAGDNGGAASWDVQYNNNASIGFFRPYGGSPTGIYSSAGTIALNTWYHIAVVCNAGSARLYINGVLVAGPVTISLPTSAAQGLRIGYDDPGTVNFQYNGYLSNVRIVKGVAVYTSAFTPSTTPLTATQSSGTNISAITGTATSLLTCQSNRFVDNSTNAFVVTITGDVAVQRFSPFGPSAAYTASTISGSGYFDGTGDYISIPSNAVFQFGTGDFTIECWFYDTGTSDTYPGLISSVNGWQTGSTALRFNNLANRRFGFYHNPTGDPVFSSTNTFNSYQWCHVVVARSGTSLKMFVNGVQEASTTMSVSISLDTTTGVFIGSGFDASSKIKGYISDVRIVKGVAVYTANFTPPSAPLTAITNTSLLLNMTSAGVYDSTMINDLETVGDAKILSTQTPYAGSYYSNYFDGTGDYLTVPSNAAFAMGTGDFTIETWFYRTGPNPESSTYSQNIFDFRSAEPQVAINIGWDGGNSGYANKIYVYVNGSYLAVSTTSTVINTWYHVAYVRSGATAYLYINGVMEASSAISSNFTATPCFIGGRFAVIGTDRRSWNGYLSNARIVKGTAVYTGTFTPSTTPLTATQAAGTNIVAITGTATSLLTCQSNRFLDNSTNAFTITKNGDTSVQSFNPFQRNSGSSMLFSGSSGSNPTTRVRGYGPVYNLNAANFTVEMWYYPTAHNSTGYPILYSSYESWVSGSVYNGLIGLLAGNQNYAVGSKNKVYLSLGDNYWYGTTTVPPLNTWTHIALVRDVNRFMIFINGTMEVDTTQAAGTMTNNQLAVVGGGTDAAGLNCITGYINDFRLTKGVARYTSTFTPPTSAFLTT